MLRIYPVGGMIDINNLFNNDVIMSSLVTNLNRLTVIGSAAQEIVNWVTTADWCVHTADATQLDSCVASAVCIARNASRQSALFQLRR